MIRGELVDLRPLTAADVERAERVANDPGHNGPFGTYAGAWRDICLSSKLRGE